MNLELILFVAFMSVVLTFACIYIIKEDKWYKQNCPLNMKQFVTPKNIKFEVIKNHKNLEIIKETSLTFNYQINMVTDIGKWVFTYDFYKQWDGIKLRGNKLEFYNSTNSKVTKGQYYGSYDLD